MAVGQGFRQTMTEHFRLRKLTCLNAPGLIRTQLPAVIGQVHFRLHYKFNFCKISEAMKKYYTATASAVVSFWWVV